jgi:hypothetical protein
MNLRDESKRVAANCAVFLKEENKIRKEKKEFFFPSLLFSPRHQKIWERVVE